MSAGFAARRSRLEPLLSSARSFALAGAPRALLARERLARSTGLSAAGIDFALERCLEASPDEAEIEALLRTTPESSRAHVLLSANVFVAAHRAIAIGLASSERVFVRASRREPVLAELLLAGAPGCFQLEQELQPQAGDHFWAYGTDRTLREVAERLPARVVFHGHGSGFGLALITEEPSSVELARIVRGLAEDVALFDQQGCLSPRAVLVQGRRGFARDFAAALAHELNEIEQRIPRGTVEPGEAAQASAYRDTCAYAGEVLDAGKGSVGYRENGPFVLPPPGRNVHVGWHDDALSVLTELTPLVTSIAFFGATATRERVAESAPGARVCDFGRMQCPPFDGPVDRRTR